MPTNNSETPVTLPPSAPVTIDVNSIWIHRGSGKVYTVTVIADGRISYARMGDGATYTVVVATFASSFRPPTAEEAAWIPTELARLQGEATSSGSPCRAVDIHRLTNPASEPEARRRRDETPEVGILVQTTEHDVFEHLVLEEENVTQIKAGVRSILNRGRMNEVWHIPQMSPNANRTVLSFWGAPGCGKTRAARAVARLLGKPLYQVDYANVISCYIGNTAKNIKAAFQKATQHNAVLFFDEADSLMSRRVNHSGDQAFATSINQNRNVLMQELDRFQGVVICATNMHGNIDPAIHRRINRHVHFGLPSIDQLAELYRVHIPAADRIVGQPDLNAFLLELASVSGGLSGGDVLNVCLNSFERASSSENEAEWLLTKEIIVAEIQAVQSAKKANAANHPKRQVAAPVIVPDDDNSGN